MHDLLSTLVSLKSLSLGVPPLPFTTLKVTSSVASSGVATSSRVSGVFFWIVISVAPKFKLSVWTPVTLTLTSAVNPLSVVAITFVLPSPTALIVTLLSLPTTLATSVFCDLYTTLVVAFAGFNVAVTTFSSPTYALLIDDLDNFIADAGYDVRCFGFDPYNAREFVERWERENGPFGIEKVIQGAKTESVPLGELKKLAEERMLLFDEELMTFAMGNCITSEDTNGNRKLLKKRYDQKIDAVAAMMDAYVAFKLNREAFD